MKAISVKNNDLNSPVEDCFGKAKYFCIINGDKEPEFLENPGYVLNKDSGIKAVEFLNKKNVKTVISGNFGISAKKKLDEFKMQIVLVPVKYRTVGELLKLTGTGVKAGSL
jgi:predicted Fe-Mo cluster-binding NifX family protein